MGLLSAFEIGKAGIDVHGKRIEIAATNIANLDTPNYTRKIPIINATSTTSFSGLLNSMQNTVFASGTIPMASNGVKMSGIIDDTTLGEKIYKPGHPDADANGYIRTSNVNALTEIADATLARRAFEANSAIITITKTMGQRALEIGRS